MRQTWKRTRLLTLRQEIAALIKRMQAPYFVIDPREAPYAAERSEAASPSHGDTHER